MIDHFQQRGLHYVTTAEENEQKTLVTGMLLRHGASYLVLGQQCNRLAGRACHSAYKASHIANITFP